jgi:hypothetical protein
MLKNCGNRQHLAEFVVIREEQLVSVLEGCCSILKRDRHLPRAAPIGKPR